MHVTMAMGSIDGSLQQDVSTAKCPYCIFGSFSDSLPYRMTTIMHCIPMSLLAYAMQPDPNVGGFGWCLRLFIDICVMQ